MSSRVVVIFILLKKSIGRFLMVDSYVLFGQSVKCTAESILVY